MNYRRIAMAAGVLLLMTLLSGNLVHAGTTEDRPRLVNNIALAAVPRGVAFQGEKLYITYRQSGKVEILDQAGNPSSGFKAVIMDGEAYPEGIALIDGQLAVTDFSKGTLGFFSSDGRLIDGFFQGPEGKVIRPRGIYPFKQVYYLTDANLPGWLAVHRSGEVLLSFQDKEEKSRLVEPYGIVVTEDARAIITDPAQGKIKVYSCSGWFVYDFEQVDEGLTPYGIAIDSLGRIHVVDKSRQKLFVYSNQGKFLFAYRTSLPNPQNIAINPAGRTIYLTGDSNQIEVWKY